MSYLDELKAEDVVINTNFNVFSDYDCYYRVSIIMEPYTPSLAGWMVRRMLRMLNLIKAVDNIDIDRDGNYNFEIEAEKPVTQGNRKRMLNWLISIVDEVVKAGKLLYIRIYRSNTEDREEEIIVFANIVTNGVRINKEMMMEVVKEMCSQKMAKVTVEVRSVGKVG